MFPPTLINERFSPVPEEPISRGNNGCFWPLCIMGEGYYGLIRATSAGRNWSVNRGWRAATAELLKALLHVSEVQATKPFCSAVPFVS